MPSLSLISQQLCEFSLPSSAEGPLESRKEPTVPKAFLERWINRRNVFFDDACNLSKRDHDTTKSLFNTMKWQMLKGSLGYLCYLHCDANHHKNYCFGSSSERKHTEYYNHLVLFLLHHGLIISGKLNSLEFMLLDNTSYFVYSIVLRLWYGW